MSEMIPDRFYTIKKAGGPAEIKEKNSRFISWVFPAQTPEEAENRVAKLWKKYHNATHICYGWRIGQGMEDSVRTNDDGEPSGTAGQPILNEIRKHELFNAVLCVVRYFGGVKLGTGGLLRAYRTSAEAVLQAIRPVTVMPMAVIRFSVPYDQIGAVIQVMNTTENVRMSEPVYSQEKAEYTVEVPVKMKDEFKTHITGATSGRAEFF
jgi:uncharacterized YigZ family protein